MPTKEDADSYGNVLWLLKSGDTYSLTWDMDHGEQKVVAWMPIPPYTPIPEIPEGYRLLRKDEYSQKKHPKARVLVQNTWCLVGSLTAEYSGSFTYIVPIEPEPQYRPFRDAEEFRPHRDRWWRYKDSPGTKNPPQSYHDLGVSSLFWCHAFELIEFDDGIPFGMLVD